MTQAADAPGRWPRLRRREETPPRTLEELLAAARWRRQPRDPELKKALGYVQASIAEARRLLAQPPGGLSLRNAEVLERLRDTLDVRVSSLTIDSAWEIYSEIKALLPLLGDADYVATQLDHEAERRKQPSRWHAWTEHFSEDDLDQLRAAYRHSELHPRLHAQAVGKLAFLYAQRAEAGRDRRAKAAQKRRYLNLLAPALLLFQAGLVVAIDALADETGVWKQILVAASAGALGATLAGTMKIRDDLRELDDLRSFWPAMRVQPLVGATAGLVVLLVLESATLDTGAEPRNWAGQALVAFAAGFSEPFFLGLVQRVAVIPDRKPSEDAEAEAGTDPQPARPPGLPET